LILSHYYYGITATFVVIIGVGCNAKRYLSNECGNENK